MTGGPPYDRLGNAWVSIGPDDTVYVSSLLLNVNPTSPGTALIDSAVAVTTSRDQGMTWSNPVVVNAQGADKDTITADPRRPGTAYLVWRGNTGHQAGQVMAMTADGGRTWNAPSVIIPLPLPTRYVFQVSSDHGMHFGSRHVLAGPFDFRRFPTAGGYFAGDYVGLTTLGTRRSTA